MQRLRARVWTQRCFPKRSGYFRVTDLPRRLNHLSRQRGRRKLRNTRRAREIMMMGTFQARPLLVLIAAAAAIALPFHPDRARSAEPPAPDLTSPDSSSNSRQRMDSVTIEAQRERQL